MTAQYGPQCCTAGIRGYGDPSRGVTIIGIAPGADEILRTKRPFTGASGQLLDKLLAFAGWSREMVYTTNVICWCNNAPCESELAVCRERFQRELRLVAPRLIITAGAIANEAVLGVKRRKGSRGSVVWSARWDCYVLDTHHPSFALQAKSMSAVQDIIRDLSKIPIILKWAPNSEDAQVRFHTVVSLEEAQAVLDNLPHDTPVALDIETSSLDIETIDAYSDQLLCFSLSYLKSGLETTVVVPRAVLPTCIRTGTHAKSHRTGEPCNDATCPHPTTRYLLRWPTNGVQWTFQAGQYDVSGIDAYFGVTLPLAEDTMLLSYCTDERPGYHGLKNNAREWLGSGWYEDPVKPFYKGRMHLLSDDAISEYNAKDAAYTRRLLPVFTQRAKDDGTYGTYRNLLLPAIRTFIDMQIRGIKVDQARLQELAYDNWFPKYIQDYQALQAEAADIGWPAEDININSNPQLAKLFYNIIGLDITKYTKGGKPSVDKETLDRMDHPFAAKLRAFRTLDTMIDYVFAVYNHLKSDGLLHPSAFVTTTRTGRTSYRDPAMQTLPKDYTVGADYARLREIIVPHNSDTHVLIDCDFNQIEVWLAWFHAQDPVLLEHLKSGDVHSATAEGAFKTKRNLWSPQDWSVKRQNAKKLRFGISYGEGAEKLASPSPVGMGCSVQEARAFINNFWATYHEHYRWTQRIHEQVVKQGYLRSASGRVMRFPLVMDHKALRQGINFPISVDASDYNLTSMIELHQKLPQYNSWLLLNIHDSLSVECDRRYITEVVTLMREVMQKPRFDGYPSLKVEVKVGNNLGSMEKV